MVSVSLSYLPYMRPFVIPCPSPPPSTTTTFKFLILKTKKRERTDERGDDKRPEETHQRPQMQRCRPNQKRPMCPVIVHQHASDCKDLEKEDGTVDHIQVPDLCPTYLEFSWTKTQERISMRVSCLKHVYFKTKIMHNTLTLISSICF